MRKLVLLLYINLIHLFSLSAQTIVSGTAKNAQGDFLDGVSVAIKNSRVATSTNKTGKYSIRVEDPNAVLVFTSVGAKTQEVEVDGRSSIDVVLEEDPKSMQNVIVVGYGSQKKADLTGAVEQIGSSYFEDRPVANISRALQGVIPNLNIVQTDGRPITNPVYNVRGVTSIGAGGEALILIDGVEGDPFNLNPNDIESITVLKDAASAAIYGARGAFGVILITTKTPKKGRIQFTYSGNYTILQQNAKLDLVTDGYLWTKMFDESYRSWFGTSATTIGGAIPFSQAYLDSLKYRAEHPGLLPEVSVNPANGLYVYYGNTNWLDELYAKRTPAMEHSFNISGASDKIDYVLSGRYYNQEGIFKYSPDHYNKYNLRFKGGVQANRWLKLTGNTDFSSFDYKYPLASVEDPSTNFFAQRTNGFPVTVMFNPDGTLTKDAANGPGALLYGKSVSISKQTFIRNTVSFNATPIANLSIKGDFTYQNSSFETDEKRVPVPYSERIGEIRYSAAGRSQLRKTTSKTNYYAANLYAEYRGTFGSHGLKALVGGNLENSSLKRNLFQRDDLILPDLADFNLATGKNFIMSGGGSEWATVGFFYRLNYDFRNKYLLQLNGRYDGSSKFPVTDQFSFFPSVSAAWKLAEEKFFRGTRGWLNNLKLRASYGSLGNSQIAPYMYTEQLRASTSTNILNGALPTYVQQPAVLSNNLTWEESTTLDFGVDIDLLQSKLSANFDWYQRKTTNMITVGQPLPSVFGAAVPLGNNADLITKGFELTLRWADQIKAKKPIDYDVRFTLADNNAYITKFYNPNNLITTYYAGQRVGEIWGYVTEGLFVSEEDIAKHADQRFITVSASNKLFPGDIKFRDLNGDGKIDRGNNTLQNPGDRQVIGNSRPRFTYGLTTNWKWNNFSLSVFFQGVGKRDWYPSGGTYKFWGQYGSWYGILPRHTLEMRWTEENPNAYFPRYRGPMPYPGRELDVQSRYLQDASYIRLKNISLAYSLSGKLLQRLNISKLQFYITGQNLWTYSPMYKITKGFDVEVIAPSVYDPGGAASGDGNTYPMLKSYTFGLNLSF